jgi:hypothetical protein
VPVVEAETAPAEAKAVADDTETGTAEIENKAVSAAEVETKAPEVAPLEAPPAPTRATAPPKPVGPDALLPAEIGDCIVDELTGLAPTDPDGVFEPVPPYGNVWRSTKRLIEHISMGPYRTPASRLLLSVGAEVQRQDAEHIVATLRAQLGE